jgi:hypothetical protein
VALPANATEASRCRRCLGPRRWLWSPSPDGDRLQAQPQPPRADSQSADPTGSIAASDVCLIPVDSASFMVEDGLPSSAERRSGRSESVEKGK